MSLQLFDKQLDFFTDKGSRLNFLTGSVRSGKTFVSLWKFAMTVLESPREYEFIMCGKTITSLKRNCLYLLESMVGRSNFRFHTTSKEAILFGHKIYLEGANDERSENKIRGMTLGGAYCDEITLYPKSFVQMLLSRLSLRDAQLFATCNPDNPHHYIKQEFIDSDELDISVWHFRIDENIFLDRDYVEQIKKEYSGVFYQRYILGEWVRAEGVIYKAFANDYKAFTKTRKDKLPRFGAIVIGVDFGDSRSATTFVAVGLTMKYKEVYILDEYYSIDASQTPEGLNGDYTKFVNRVKSQYSSLCDSYVTRADSAEGTLINGLKTTTIETGVQVKRSIKRPIIDRIRLVQLLMGEGRFWVMEDCKYVIDAFQNAMWNDKKDFDERLDDFTSNIDSIDATEYAIEPFMKQLTIAGSVKQ